MRSLLLGFIGLLLLSTSCKKNTYVIPSDQMVDILVDIHMAEAVLFQNKSQYDLKEEKLGVYKSVYDKHGISKARLDSSINYYLFNAPEYDAIYAEVVKRLETMEEEVQNGKYVIKNELLFTDLPKAIQEMDSLEKDSVIAEIWKLQREYKLPQEGEKRTLSFSFDNDSTNRFLFLVLKADIILYYNDCSQNPQVSLNISYKDGSKNSVFLPLNKNANKTKIRLRLEVDSAKLVNTIFGELIGHDQCASKKNAVVNNIRLYKMNYPDTTAQKPELLDLKIDPDFERIKPVISK